MKAETAIGVPIEDYFANVELGILTGGELQKTSYHTRNANGSINQSSKRAAGAQDRRSSNMDLKYG